MYSLLRRSRYSSAVVPHVLQNVLIGFRANVSRNVETPRVSDQDGDVRHGETIVKEHDDTAEDNIPTLVGVEFPVATFKFEDARKRDVVGDEQIRGIHIWVSSSEVSSRCDLHGSCVSVVQKKKTRNAIHKGEDLPSEMAEMTKQKQFSSYWMGSLAVSGSSRRAECYSSSIFPHLSWLLSLSESPWPLREPSRQPGSCGAVRHQPSASLLLLSWS